MANPQKENGYLRIANEIIEALAKAMPGFTEGQIIWCVIRKTYGWNKKTDKISISQIMEMTKKSRRMVIYALQNLEAKKMINVYRENYQINQISFQKDYQQWIVQEKAEQYKKVLENKRNNYKKVVQEKASSARSSKNRQVVVQEIVKSIPILAPTKDTITKDNIYIDIDDEKSSEVAPAPSSSLNNLRNYYYNKYKDKFNKQYVAAYGKDGKIFKDLRSYLSDDEISLLIDRFFASDDTFILNSDYSTGVFRSQVNKLRIETPQSEKGYGHFLKD